MHDTCEKWKNLPVMFMCSRMIVVFSEGGFVHGERYGPVCSTGRLEYEDIVRM